MASLPATQRTRGAAGPAARGLSTSRGRLMYTPLARACRNFIRITLMLPDTGRFHRGNYAPLLTLMDSSCPGVAFSSFATARDATQLPRDGLAAAATPALWCPEQRGPPTPLQAQLCREHPRMLAQHPPPRNKAGEISYARASSGVDQRKSYGHLAKGNVELHGPVVSRSIFQETFCSVSMSY